MKILRVLMLLVFLTSLTKAQECGYTKLVVYLTDVQGQLIKNAEIKTFDKNFDKEDILHYPNGDTTYDYSRDNISSFRLMRDISWSEEKQAYLGGEGMCSGHRDVGLRISAKGFETFDRIIDLPLGWTIYSIKLKHKGKNEVVKVEKGIHVTGKISDENKTYIGSADLLIVDGKGKKYQLKSDDYGRFVVDLFAGNYSLQVSKNGFKTLKVINFQVKDTEIIYLDLILKVSNENVSGQNNKEEGRLDILDCQIIKRKN